ncbi:fungal-specific transcription factor domain-containing protein [Massariosphaeria phaeospora]|uniref:Fungal-specific transcription factor domain-containing protein n=1 Tax=Massariosphaeria phaeospora TaxID=100035 RepID=A0A7C8MKD1_9PLEO|nr:fungal-specific transcription factor domain-containing protein [Massariosphaeria phaeospora]
MTPPSPRARVDRTSTACRNCRERKVRCSGEIPCRDCVRLRKQCVYPPVQRKKRKTRDHPSPNANRNTHAHDFESIGDAEFPIVQATDDTRSPTQSSGSAPACHDGRTALATLQLQESIQAARPANRHFQDQDFVRRSSDFTLGFDVGLSRNLEPGDTGTSLNRSSWQYHEPWSWMSILSEQGSNLIRQMTDNQEFVSAAQRFSQDFVQEPSSKYNLSIPADVPKPTELGAKEYAYAFYQNCWEADLGIIDRVEVEALIEAHYKNEEPEDDASSFALRNIIFAAGYRSLLAKDPAESFSAAQEKAGCYFQAALSVFTRLLIPPSSLTAVRALILMACYAEGLANPGFKHFLCSNAVHLAQSQGLHRELDQISATSENAAVERNWLWWAIYSLEKHLALSSGRPSSIDDHNISVQIPKVVPLHSSIQLESLSIVHRHAKLSSQISRQLLSFKALSIPADELIERVTHFHSQLDGLLKEMPAEFSIDTVTSSQHPTRRLTQILYLHFSIYGSIMAIHTHFFYPWMASRLAGGDKNAILEAQIISSSNALAEAARKIILALRLINGDVTTPSWLAFSHPIQAVANLFFYILRYPTLPTASSDLSLLGMGAGHFGYLEYLTSSRVSISLPRDLVNIASQVVKAAKAAKVKQSPATSVEVSNDQRLQVSFTRRAPAITNPGSRNLGHNLDSATWNLLTSFDMICPNAASLESIQENRGGGSL